MRIAALVFVLAAIGGCGSDDDATSSPEPTEPTAADYQPVREDRWQGVDWTLYVAEQADPVCAEWTGTSDGDTPVNYPSSLDLERRSCIGREVLTRAHGTVVQPMFSYRLPGERVGVWGVTSADVERIEVDLASGEEAPSVVSGDGTFALLLDEDSQVGEVTALLTDGTSVECAEPASLSEFAWTCR